MRSWGWGPHNEISTLIRRGRDTRALSTPCEDAARRRPSVSQEKSSHQNPTMLAPQSWTSQPPDVWEINTGCFSHPVCGILQQPKGSETLTPFFYPWKNNVKVTPILDYGNTQFSKPWLWTTLTIIWPVMTVSGALLTRIIWLTCHNHPKRLPLLPPTFYREGLEAERDMDSCGQGHRAVHGAAGIETSEGF